MPKTEAASNPLLHIIALWIDGDDHIEKIKEDLAPYKLEGTAGAVVTFAPEQADALNFRRTMERLNLEEVNDRG